MANMNFFIQDKLHDKVRLAAVKAGIPIKTFVTQAIQEKLEKK